MTRPIDDGFTEWPTELADDYRAAGYWQGETLGTLPRAWAAQWPDEVAVIEGGRVLTFRELDQALDRVAAGLLQLGLRGAPHGDRLLIQMPNCLDTVVLVLAACRAGVIPVLALPAHREKDLNHLAQLSEAVAIAVPDSFRGYDHVDLARRIKAESPSIEHIIVSSPDELPGLVTMNNLLAAPAGAAVNEPDSGAVALLLLSGGTTGTPKLIPRTHDDYVYNLRASAPAAGVAKDTVLLLSIPVAHNFGLGCPGVLGVLEVGGKVVLEPSPEPARAFAAMDAHGVTHAAIVPAILQRWLDHAESGGHRPQSLQYVHVGGARLVRELAQRVRPTLNATVQQALGMAEGLINYTRAGDPDHVAFETQGRPISPADEFRIVDPDGTDVTPGGIGELWTRGPYTIRGYWRAPEHNERAFDPAGWYRTGDLVRWDASGNFVVEGRLKDVINRGGEKISAEEVENSLYAIPSIRRVAVVAQPDTRLGEIIAAVIVPTDPGSPPALAEIRDELSRTGVAGHKRPDVIHILEDLPLTKVGKVDRVVLRELVRKEQAGVPTGTGSP